MTAGQLRRLKELEKESERMRRAVSDLTLDKLILAEAAKGNFWPPLGEGIALGWCATAQRPWIPAPGTGNDHPTGPEAVNTPTMKADQSVGTGQWTRLAMPTANEHAQ